MGFVLIFLNELSHKRQKGISQINQCEKCVKLVFQKTTNIWSIKIHLTNSSNTKKILIITSEIIYQKSSINNLQS